MKKSKPNNGLVYSTDPNFKIEEEVEDINTPPKNDQKLKIILDTKKRAGKVVTLILGFIGQESDLEILGKKLKKLCGTGGSVKDFEIIIQGDHREKIFNYLIKEGYKNTKK